MTITLSTATTVARSHSAVLDCRNICELALGKIGAFTVNDTAADPTELDRALQWMDLIVSNLAGTNKCHWLIGGAVSMPLFAGEQTYDIADAVGTELPAGGVLFPIAAYLSDDSGNDTPVEIISRSKYNSLPKKATSGTPCAVYIDRLDTQTINVYPVPAEDDQFTLKIDVQTYAPDMNRGNGDAQHGFSAEWQLYLVTAIAAETGDGPIRRLDASALQRLRLDAKEMKEKLLATSNREFPNQSGLRRTKAWGRKW